MPEKNCKAENVRFARIVMMFFTLSYAFFSLIESMYVVWGLTFLALIFGVDRSATTWLLWLIRRFGILENFGVDERCKRSYQITRVMEYFEDGMRLFFASGVIALHYFGHYIAATSLAYMMSMFMIISAYFGFCMSGLLYVVYQRFFGKSHEA